MRFKFWLIGFLSGMALLGVYFSVLTLISGWNFAQSQFFQYWYFIVSLAAGFGVQLGLYFYFKELARRKNLAGKVVAATGATSTLAMISCCSHYLANILPFLAAGGVLGFIGQYQVDFFWLGIVFNLIGLAYILKKIVGLKNSLV